MYAFESSKGVQITPTQNHKIIRQWALRHNAAPAEIMPRKFDGEPAILTFLMGNAKTGTPEIIPITWESFFAQFDLLGLAFAFDPHTCEFELLRVVKKPDTLSINVFD